MVLKCGDLEWVVFCLFCMCVFYVCVCHILMVHKSIVLWKMWTHNILRSKYVVGSESLIRFMFLLSVFKEKKSK